jgi:hypothetical protein
VTHRPPRAAGSAPSDRVAAERARWLLVFLALACTALPLLAVDFLPSTDLPQHVAQVRLLGDALAARSDTYQIGWTSPGTLIYGLLAAGCALFDPIAAGRVVVLLLALASTGATALLAWRRGRAPEAVALASVLTFNASLSWGFLNFETGWPVFVLWVLLTSERRQQAGPGWWLALTANAVLLYASHALWFLLGAVWCVASFPWKRGWTRATVAPVLALVPPSLLAGFWYRDVRAFRAIAGFNLEPRWFTPPWRRLHPDWLVDATFGSLEGTLEPVAFGAIALWVVAAVVSHGRDLRRAVDPRLAALSATFLTLALLLPDMYMNTVRFAQRWAPAGLATLLLALPAPRASPALLRFGVAGLVLTFSLATTAAYKSYEREELSGLSASLQAVPTGARVLGLDLVKHSEFIIGRPFLQMVAYAQALRGAELAFSFASHGSSIVSYRRPRVEAWTGGLDFHPERLRPSDLEHFDVILVNALAPMHQVFECYPGVEPLTSHPGRWRLYRSARARALSTVTPRRGR